ncbi:MAG: M20 family metallopeptidase [Dehalococcoidia bacterium]
MLDSVASELKQDADALQPQLVELRRDFHMHPEPAYQEVRTAGIAADRLRALGMQVTTGIGGTGVVAVLEGVASGKTVMLRTDMDGVEQQDEAPGREYGSQVPGMNHSCGHDIDLAVFLGAASLLASRRESLNGRVAFVVQPADEPRTGAAAMIRDGLWDLVQPDYLLSHHIAPDLDAGKIVAQGGHLWASSDQWTIRVRREDAAMPHVTLVAARLIDALYDAVETEAEGGIFPVNFAVFELKGSQPRRGEAEATLELRCATNDAELRERVLARIREVCETIGTAHAATAEIEVVEATAPIVNDVHVGAVAAEAVREIAGDAALVQDFRHAVPDDFSLMLERAPGAMLLIGTRNEAKGLTAMWHTPEYDTDEEVLSLSAAVLAASVLRLLKA